MTSVEIVPVSSPLNDTQRQFVRRVLRRKRLFLVLSVAGIVVAVGLGVVYGFFGIKGHHLDGPRSVIIVLVLLNARQNLRQFRYAEILEKIVGGSLDEPPAA